MGVLKVYRQVPQQPLLQRIIRYLWLMDSGSNVVIDHQLLPVANADLIINHSASVKYIRRDKKVITQNSVHVNGIRKESWQIIQNGYLKIAGISFREGGLYPLSGFSAAEFFGLTVEAAYLPRYLQELSEKMDHSLPPGKYFAQIEEYLMEGVNAGLLPSEEDYEILNSFGGTICTGVGIHSFCEKTGVGERRLERLFLKHVGVSPKQYIRLRRFQRSARRVMQSDYNSLAEVSCDNGYYDQNHFIKEFKEYAGVAPAVFRSEKKMVRSVMDYN